LLPTVIAQNGGWIKNKLRAAANRFCRMRDPLARIDQGRAMPPSRWFPRRADKLGTSEIDNSDASRAGLLTPGALPASGVYRHGVAMSEGTQQVAPATYADPLADFLAEAIAVLDAMLAGTPVEQESPPEAEKKPRKKKPAVIADVSAGDAVFESRAAA
jgi:hypothetical protein